MSTIDYVKVDTAPLYSEATNGSPVLHLLWGDQVDAFEEVGSRVKVRARDRCEFSMGHAVASRAKVDALLAQAEAGATLTARPTSARGASTPATSATSMATSGRSCGTQGWNARTGE